MTSNRALILRPSITDWIMKEIHSRWKDKKKRIGIVCGKDRKAQVALKPIGETYECRAFNTMTQREERVKFNTWDLELDLYLLGEDLNHIVTPPSTEELSTLAKNISQLERLQTLKLDLPGNSPPLPNLTSTGCANLRTSFVDNLKIETLPALTKLSLFPSNIHLSDP